MLDREDWLLYKYNKKYIYYIKRDMMDRYVLPVLTTFALKANGFLLIIIDIIIIIVIL